MAYSLRVLVRVETVIENAFGFNIGNYVYNEYEYVTGGSGSKQIVIPLAGSVVAGGREHKQMIAYVQTTPNLAGSSDIAVQTVVGTRWWGAAVDFSKNYQASDMANMAALVHDVRFDTATLTLVWNNYSAPTDYHFTVNITGTGTGTVSPASGDPIYPGHSYKISATPDEDSSLTSFVLNGGAITNPYTWEATAANATLEVKFTSDQIRILHSIEGEGTIDAPAEGFYDPGSYTVTATPSEGYTLSELRVESTVIENGSSFNFTDDETTWFIYATFVPVSLTVTVRAKLNANNCNPDGTYVSADPLVFVAMNYSAYTSSGWFWAFYSAGEPGQTEEAEEMDYGRTIFPSAHALDARLRLVAFRVNGVEQVISPNSTGHIHDPITLTESITIEAEWTPDMGCYIPQLPLPGTSGPTTGPTPTNPTPSPFPGDDTPPGTPPIPPPPSPPPGGGGGGGGGGFPGGGTMIENPKEEGGGTPPDHGIARIVPLGWDRQTETAKMWIRWRDNNGEWSKEHPVDVGSPGDNEWPVWMPMRGDYSTRQWEIVITDRAPLVVVYMEEEIDIFDE